MKRVRSAKKSLIRYFVILLLITLLCLSTLAWSQAPTGLTYPTPVVYNANVNNVFLSPNVAGNVSSYSMPASPALPAGLRFRAFSVTLQLRHSAEL